MASRTGIHPEATSASHLTSISPGGGVDWAVVYDWTDSPHEEPVRIIDRGDSFFFLAEIKEAPFNGGDPIDALFMSCIPDIGILELLPANRLDIHDFYKPIIDNYSGRGVAGVPIVGVPKRYVPTVADISSNSSEGYLGNISSLDTEIEMIALSDTVPLKPIPMVDPEPGPTGRSFRFFWPTSARGYRLFESDDLSAWRPSPLHIDEEGEKRMVDVMLEIEGAKPFLPPRAN